jgi:hypothetical protein
MLTAIRSELRPNLGVPALTGFGRSKPRTTSRLAEKDTQAMLLWIVKW